MSFFENKALTTSLNVSKYELFSKLSNKGYLPGSVL